MTDPVTCQFCKRPCRRDYSPLSMVTWRCDYHGSAVVRYALINNIYDVVLAFQYRDSTYHATFINDPNSKFKFKVEKIIPKKYRPETVLVFALEFQPEITPENVQKKMCLYMVFS